MRADSQVSKYNGFTLGALRYCTFLLAKISPCCAMPYENFREVNLHLVTDGLGDSSYYIEQHTVRFQALLEEILSFIFRYSIKVKSQEKVKKSD